MTSADEFIEFATVASPRLRRTAFLLCGDWHTAEDLAQTTLAKMFAAWRRVRQLDAVYPYATRTLVNTYLAGREADHGRRPSHRPARQAGAASVRCNVTPGKLNRWPVPGRGSGARPRGWYRGPRRR